VSKPAPSELICRQVAEILREEREAQSLSMNRLAEMAGLSQQMISYIERGMRNPTLDSTVRIARALRVDLADVIRQAQRVAPLQRSVKSRD